MKKQIVINASKDRSRIAIVEDGELVELYVENPDNVRTIGNVYLGRVQKVMPAIRAAFVDVGQKQDCFLHFSDLTDNFPQLLAMAGEEVPGLDEPVLSLAPTKRIADDETEPDPEETLEVESGDDESRSRRTRGRRSRGRGRSRRSGGGRREEEEEQEEGRRLPHVIDLTAPPRSKPAPRKEAETADNAEEEAPQEEAPKKRRTRAKKSEETAEPDAEAADQDTPEPDEAPKKRRSRRKKAADETPAPSEDETTETPEASDDDEQQDEAPKKSRRRRSRRGRGATEPGDDQADADSESDDDESEPVADEKKKEDKTRSGRRVKPAPAPVARDDNRQPEETEETSDEPKTKRLPASIDLTAGGGRTSSRSTPDDEADDTSSRSGRSRRRTRSAEAETSEASDAPEKEEDDTKTSRRGRRSSSDESGGRRGRRGSTRTSEETDDASENTKPEQTSSRRRTRGESSKDDSSKSAEPRRSRQDDSNGQKSGPSRGGSKGRSSSGPIPPNEQLLRRDGRVIVKITKEPISTKGPRVSTDLSLAGRFLVLVPAADYVAVSKKIESAKERRRLRTLASSLKPDGFGVIVRTVAEGRDAKSLDQDLRLLTDKWRKIENKLAEKPEPPVLLYEDVNMVSSVIRDLFSDDYDRILVDDPKVFRNVQAYVKAVAPQMSDKVELHKGRTTAFRSVGIESQVEEAFSKRVNMKSGGYLYIETTEAMHVVDVNSGRAGRGKSQKQNLIDVNVEAAKEVAKQLRLRDLGGIIVVDFIDLKYDRDRKKVTDALKEAFEKDRAVTKLLPMSDFGLVQITRQRLRPSITTQAQDEDGEPLRGADLARAAGAAEIRTGGRRSEPEPETYEDDVLTAEEPQDDSRDEAPDRPVLAAGEATPEAITARLRGWLDRYRREVDERYKGRPIVIRVHPLLGAYLRRGFPSPLTRWRLSLRGVPFQIEEDAGVDPLAFDVRDQKSGRPLLKKYAA